MGFGKFLRRITRFSSRPIFPRDYGAEPDTKLALAISRAEFQMQQAISMAKKTSELLQSQYALALWTAKNRASLLAQNLAPTRLELAVINTPQPEIDKFLHANQGFFDTFICDNGTSRMTDIQKKILGFMLIEEAQFIKDKRIAIAQKMHQSLRSGERLIHVGERTAVDNVVMITTEQKAAIEAASLEAKQLAAAAEAARVLAGDEASREKPGTKNQIFDNSPSNSSSSPRLIFSAPVQYETKPAQRPNEEGTPECHRHRFHSKLNIK